MVMNLKWIFSTLEKYPIADRSINNFQILGHLGALVFGAQIPNVTQRINS